MNLEIHYSYIYEITNKIDGKSYIGKTITNIEKYINEHFKIAMKTKNPKKYFYRAIRKYGKEKFTWRILWEGECNNVHLNNLEIFFIDYYNTNIGNNGNGYNCSKGGDGGDLITNHPNRKEIYKNISNSKKGEKNPSFGKPGTFLNKKHNKKSIIDMKKSKKGKYKGSENPNWKGGKINLCSVCSKVIYRESKMCKECWHKHIVGKNNPVYGRTFNQKKVKCPICGKIGGIGNMKRYHFNNCKEIKENEPGKYKKII